MNENICLVRPMEVENAELLWMEPALDLPRWPTHTRDLGSPPAAVHTFFVKR